jgi:hypothetical protein
MHKGFKCLNISTGRIYISCDVLFDESIFHFASLHSTAGARYRLDVLLSPTTDLGDNNFANTANVHALPLWSVVDCCPHVPNPEPGMVCDADSPTPGGSATQHPALAPIGAPNSSGLLDTGPSAPIIDDQHPTTPGSTLVPVPGAPTDTVPVAHASLPTSPGCQATPSTSVSMSCALPSNLMPALEIEFELEPTHRVLFGCKTILR